VAKSEAAFLNIGGNLSKAIPSKLTATCRQLAIWVYTEIYILLFYILEFLIMRYQEIMQEKY